MKRFLFFVCILSANAGLAQDFLGVQSSNYSGLIGVYSNPANIADNRMKVDVVLTGSYFHLDNNYFGVKRSALAYSGSITDPSNIKFTDPSWSITDINRPDGI